MAAVREIHGQNLVARFNGGEIDRHVRLRAAVRLHVHVLGAEQSLGAIDRQLLDRIDILAAAIPAFLRITFGVFVRQHAALRFHHRAAGEIFRRDQLDVFALPFFFRADRVENFRIDLAQTAAREKMSILRSRNEPVMEGRPLDKKKRPRCAPSAQARFVLRRRARSVKRF